MKKSFMKFISAAAAAVLAGSAAASSLPGADAAAERIVILGDSIASGYALSTGESNYGDLIGDYLGADVKNYAVAGYDTDDLLAQLSDEGLEVRTDIAASDVVIISIGGNDLIHYASNKLLQVAASASCLADGYTSADIPAEPSFSDVSAMIDRDKLKEFASSTANQMTLSSELARLTHHLADTSETDTNGRYDKVIETQIIPDIESAVSTIRSLSSDTDIIVQTIYDPLELEEAYFAATYSDSYGSILRTVQPRFVTVLNSFSTQLNASAAKNGYRVADVYTDFSSADENGAKYGWYFTNMQTSRDIHPNQAGHLAIAVNILDLICDLHDDNGLAYKTYHGLSAKDSYPAAAKVKLARVLGDLSKEVKQRDYTLGDVNNDGLVDANDASEILQLYAGLSTGAIASLTEQQSYSGNVNGDSLVDANDASDILGYYAYLSTGGSLSIADYLARN